MSPESWEGQEYDIYSDLFSLGLIRESMKEKVTPSFQTHAGWKERLKKIFDKNELLMENPQERLFLKIESHRSLQKKLAHQVEICLKNKKTMEQTAYIPRGKPKKSYKSTFFIQIQF